MLALFGLLTRLDQRTKLLDDAGYGEADDDESGDSQTEQHDGGDHLAEQRQTAPCDAGADIASARGKLVGQE